MRGARKPWCVYTINFGDYDVLWEPEIVNPQIDYVCITDRRGLSSPVWRMVLVKCDKQKALKRCAAKYIAYPFDILRDYEISVLVGGQTSIHCDVAEFIDRVLPSDKSIAMMRHPVRDCIYEEAETIIELEKDRREIVEAQVAAYRASGFPEHAGLVSTGVVVRRHSDERLREHCRLWLQEIGRYSQRDQMSFNYVLWKHRLVDPAYFPQSVRGTDFRVRGHRYRQTF
jgi:hypothetical protein